MKRLEISDILKANCNLKSRKISEEEFRPFYERCTQGQKRILELKERSENPSYEDLSKVINPYLRSKN